MYYDFKNDDDLFFREFIAFFRDPEDLIKSYLKPRGFDEKLFPQIELIRKKVKALESSNQIYRQMLQT